MSSHRQQRLPVSCENCRKRKIRCLGDGPPCQTCVKRGLSSTCHFLKHQSTRLSRLSQDDTPSSIVRQMETLQALLKENISLTQRSLLRDSPYPPSGATPSSSTESQTNVLDLRRSGQLIGSVTGHVRYVTTQSAFLDLTQDSSSIDLPFSDRSNMTSQELLNLLPPLSRCDELKDVFMEVFSPLFHVLHDPTFELEYFKFRNSPHDAGLTFLALVFVVLAIGVTALEEDHPLLADLGRHGSAGANMRSIAARFRDAAMRALTADHFLWRHNLQTLQTLILLIYALSHAHGPAWTLLGATLNIAIAIGCHVDPSTYNVTRVEAEERRRCWAALLMLYTIQETSLGIQAPIVIQSDTQMPADIDDDELLLVQGSSESGTMDPRPPSKMAYILHKWKLYRLAAEICSSSTSEVLNAAEIARLDGMIVMEERRQENQFAHLENLPIYHQAHYLILNSYTNHLYLVLHSYVLTKSSTRVDPIHERSIQRLSDASLSILANYNTLRVTPTFQRYRWYTDGLASFHGFLATSTLAMIYGGGHGVEVDMQKKPQVALSLQRCLEHFRSAASRSDICARASKVLTRSLDCSLVQESQAVTSNPRTSSPSSHTAGSSRRSATFEASNPRGSNLFANPPLASTSDNGMNHSPTGPPMTPQQYAQQLPTIADARVDLDGWTTNAELEDFFGQIPTQQWLSPSTFPWSKWDSHDLYRAPEVSQEAQILMNTI